MHKSWKIKLESLRELALEITRKVAADKRISYPPFKERYAAFNLEFNRIKVVIIGQDPYYSFGQANGLAFSINQDVSLTESLESIFKELHDDLDLPISNSGDLTPWLLQGVFLLNSSLSVAHGLPKSHEQHGWHEFTKSVIKIIARDLDHIVFILWGKDANDLVKGIDLSNHYVIKSTHPASREWRYKPTKTLPAFFGNKPFSKCNRLLKNCNKTFINWKIK